ncbi:MAG: six-cysteine peptide SCIFF [Ammonifex sp.]|jgi:predicted ribosomally synthesized six-cysteine peptide SCIFF|nr:MAG: six-cysteine peptide SCIFF [Ammonifex sp.]
MGKHIKTIIPGKSPRQGGCGECQASCQSACKTSCTVGNQSCKKNT